jgi:hypothetical protein
MKTVLLHPNSSLRMRSRVNVEIATQTPLSEAQGAWIPSSVDQGFVKQETVAWAARA